MVFLDELTSGLNPGAWHATWDLISQIRAQGVTVVLLAEKGIGARVLVLTTFDTDTDVVPAIEAGATGYLLKDSPPDELLRGVLAVARGEAVLSPSVAIRLLGQEHASASASAL